MAEENIQYEVKVIDAFKSYGGINVLNGININVPTCTIYGLLGPSGCGKSTLLECILGTKTLDFGCIDLKAKYLKDVGYMPQDLCLEGILTIKETFEYFGRIYKMSDQNIKTRIAELNEFLQFPDINSYIKEISGGQSKQVSLAVALIHDPKLIILDEPTVGIDVLLRQKIWVEFIKMTKQLKKTIIITTHYIEEANEANCIGLIRNGILVEEGSPQNIITKYRRNTLEEAFLSLCCSQETNEISKKKVYVQRKKKLNNTRLKSENNFDLYRIKALTKKYFRMCYRDLWFFFIVICLPMIQYNNFSISFGQNINGLSIAIKNDEVNYLDCRNFNVNGCIADENSNLTMSCVVVNYLVSLNRYKLIEVNDFEVGELSLNNPNYMAFLHFPKAYTRALAKYIDSHNDSDGESLAYARLTMDNFVFRNQIKTDVLNSINYVLKQTLIGCASNPKSISVPIKFKNLYGNEVKSLANSIVHLFIALSVFYISSITSGNIMISEKLEGSLRRSIFAGVNLPECVLSLFFISTIIQLIQIIVSCFILFGYYSNPVQITSGLFTYVLVLSFLGWVGYFIGIFIAIISKTQLTNIFLLTGVSLTQFILPGM
ncbi:Hypothetical protein CINCED_3A000710 [Cinara cedri]|uniref:ABC transporter domain-containing protein n=1 Tax=Cinara cedri TaxID=506608 RepID=A0A5E4M420_9HEMI|nr:Hypothetical protein CINCED_3A000710 [Cinara cedri]